MGERILIVEDEPPIAGAVSYALREAGYDVDLLIDGDTALAASRARPYDLMVLDLMLPGLPGLDVCRTLDVPHHAARLDGKPLALTRSEYRLVTLLASDPGRVFSREELVQQLWDSNGDRRAIDVHMSNLRRKLEDDPRNPKRLQTVRGAGYRLIDGWSPS